ncbi:MAG: biotin--[acetyl-CoA-carboxylase] ligase [Nannocystis sp.]|nr:biotin--[acetyl-CoA-carboxylase] ligase [Nannocystis sp.]
MSADADDQLAALALHLRTGSFGHVHEHYSEIDSTNDRALAWAREGAPHGALVTADAQRAGRGRRGRAWWSPPGSGLYFSVIVRPAALAGHAGGWGAVGLAVGVGLREALGPRLPRATLKWPNDLLCGGRKLAGILCEARWQGGQAEALVIGVGVNVYRERGAFGADLRMDGLPLDRGRFTNLVDEGAVVTGRAPLLADLLAGVEAALVDYGRGGFIALRGRYEAHCALRGRVVQLRGGDGEPYEAIAEGLDDDGALRVRPAAGGPSLRVEAGDVWLAPAASPPRR